MDSGDEPKEEQKQQGWEAENRAIANTIKQNYGWHFLARDVAEYLMETVPNVMKMPAADVFGWVMVMQAKAELIKTQQQQTYAN